MVSACRLLLVIAAFLGCFCLALAQPGRNRSNEERVRFFSRENYRGTQKTQQEGSFRSINWIVNSVQVPAGYVVEAFAQENFRGSSIRLVGNVTQMNGPIRSLRINRAAADNSPDLSRGRDRYGRSRRGGNSNGAPVVFFADIAFKGSTVELPVGRHAASALRALFRQASSIDVPAGYRVQAFDGENFAGHSYTFTGSNNDLRGITWNDRIASVIISRDR